MTLSKKLPFQKWDCLLLQIRCAKVVPPPPMVVKISTKTTIWYNFFVQLQTTHIFYPIFKKWFKTSYEYVLVSSYSLSNRTWNPMTFYFWELAFTKGPKLLFFGRPIVEIKMSGWLVGWRPPSRGHRPLRGAVGPHEGARRASCPPQVLERRAHSALNF